jgi:hypothetical protein
LDLGDYYRNPNKANAEQFEPKVSILATPQLGLLSTGLRFRAGAVQAVSVLSGFS